MMCALKQGRLTDYFPDEDTLTNVFAYAGATPEEIRHAAKESRLPGQTPCFDPDLNRRGGYTAASGILVYLLF
jgi:hypothetical protein